MQNEERNIEEVLEQLFANPETVKLGSLALLSDLDPDEAAVFQAEWTLLDPTYRRSIAQSMQELGEASLELDFRAVFLQLLSDTDPSVRHAAIRGLFEDTRHSTLTRILDILVHDADPAVRATAATTLGGWTLRIAQADVAPRTQELVQQTLFDVYHAPATPVEVRRRILETLGYLGNVDPVVAALTEAHQHPELPWQQSTLCAMGRTGMPRWLPTIQAAFAAPEAALRFEAARAAGEISDLARSVVPELANLAVDDDLEVATAAMWSLGQIGGDQARRLLERLAQSESGSRSTLATEALHELQFFADPLNSLPFDDDQEWDDFDPEVLN